MGIRTLFVDDLGKWWKLWSLYFFAAIGVLPDAYNAVSAMGWVDQVPHGIIWPIRALCAGGIIARLVKQRTEKTCEDDKAHS
jgi:hypothetical protein